MFSIIVPIYNIQDYLSYCIESVLGQTYSDFELILVDDGSLDRSSVICDMYTEKDSRISVIHKRNEGLSAARNDGISKATGQYVLFLDGDDYWDDKRALERLALRAGHSNADVINYSYKKVYEDSKSVSEYFHNIADMPLEYTGIKDQTGFLYKYNLYIASACNKLVKRSLLTDDMMFEKGILSEDIDWCARLLVKAESMDFICENFYCYRQRDNSITHSVDSKTCKDLADNLIRCFELRDSISAEKTALYDSYLAYMFATFFVDQALTKNPQTEEIERLSSYSWILAQGNNRKVKLLNIGCRIFGYKNLCGIIRTAYRNKRA